MMNVGMILLYEDIQVEIFKTLEPKHTCHLQVEFLWNIIKTNFF